MNILEIVNNSFSCTGCGVCTVACPAKCITMKYDKEGFLFPEVYKDKCLQCGKCVQICPEYCSIPKNIKQINGLAVWSNNRNTLSSGSGGAFYLIASHFIKDRNGVVYGCTLDLARKTVEHVRIASIEDLGRIQGSKYVQSNIIKIYSEIEQDLKHGEKVLFSGTPCQNAGIKKAFGNYDNLYTADIICHGVPSPIVFSDYLCWLEKKIGYLSEYRFRVHSRRRIQGYIAYAIGAKSKYIRKAQEDPYFNAFLNEINYRNCCYKCKYTSLERVSDITFGDCNSVAYSNPFFSKSHCASLVLLNSTKGVSLWQSCSNLFSIMEIPLVAESKYNKRMVTPSTLDKTKRDELYSLYDKGTLFDAYPFYGKKNLINRIKKSVIGSVPEYWIRIIKYYLGRKV